MIPISKSVWLGLKKSLKPGIDFSQIHSSKSLCRLKFTVIYRWPPLKCPGKDEAYEKCYILQQQKNNVKNVEHFP